MVGLVPATTEDVAIALQMLEFLRQQKRQLKKRARQIKEAQQICRAGANASGRVCFAPSARKCSLVWCI